MQRNILESFSNKENRKIFNFYETKYNKRILEKVKKFNSDTLESNEIFNSLFRDFGDTCNINSKIFSKLKHE